MSVMVWPGASPAAATGARRDGESEMGLMIDLDLTTLTESELYDLLGKVQDEIDGRVHGDAVPTLLLALEEHPETRALFRSIKAIRFGTDSWDNGYFFSGARGVITYDNGNTADIDLAYSRPVESLLTEMSSPSVHADGFIGDSNTVRIDLRTGEVTYD